MAHKKCKTTKNPAIIVINSEFKRKKEKKNERKKKQRFGRKNLSLLTQAVKQMANQSLISLFSLNILTMFFSSSHHISSDSCSIPFKNNNPRSVVSLFIINQTSVKYDYLH